jgi:hypothetical protein
MKAVSFMRGFFDELSKHGVGGETLAGIKQPKESFERFIGQTSGKEKMDYEKTLKEGIMKDPLTAKKAIGGAAPLPQRQGPAQ